jgi:hypothetical protein
MATRIQVTFDAADPPALAAFWGGCSATSSRTRPRASTAGRRGLWPTTWAVSGGRGTPPEELRRNVAAAVERAVAAGATKLREVDEGGEHWVVLQDPEGNEFCMH